MVANKFIYAVIIAALISIPLFFLPFTPEDPFLLPKSALLSFFACGAIIAVVFFSREKLSYVFSSDVFLASLLLLASFAVSIPYSVNYHEGFSEIKRWVCLIILFLLASQINWTHNRLQRVIKITTTVSFLIATYAILEYFEIIPFYPCGFEKNRLYSFFGHQNILAQYLSITILWNLSIATSGSKSKTRIMYLICIIISTIALLLTFCRGAIIATTIGWVFFLSIYITQKIKNNTNNTTFLTLRNKKKLIILVLSVVASFLILAVILLGKTPIYHEKTTKRISNLIKRGDSLRFILWKDSINMMLSSPIKGIGLGNYFIVYPKFKTGNWKWLTVDPHNELLHIVTETGIIGLSGVIIFLIIVIKYILKKIVYNFNTEIKFYLLAITSGCIATVIDSLISYDFHSSTSSLYFFVGLGILCSGEQKEIPMKLSIKNTLIRNAFIAVPIVFVSCWGMFDEYKKIISHCYYNKALESINKEDHTGCIKYSLKAVKLQPYNPKYHHLLSIAYDVIGQYELAKDHFGKVLLLTPYSNYK